MGQGVLSTLRCCGNWCLEPLSTTFSCVLRHLHNKKTKETCSRIGVLRQREVHRLRNSLTMLSPHPVLRTITTGSRTHRSSSLLYLHQTDLRAHPPSSSRAPPRLLLRAPPHRAMEKATATATQTAAVAMSTKTGVISGQAVVGEIIPTWRSDEDAD